jgi:hypothetical protein
MNEVAGDAIRIRKRPPSETGQIPATDIRAEPEEKYKILNTHNNVNRDLEDRNMIPKKAENKEWDTSMYMLIAIGLLILVAIICLVIFATTKSSSPTKNSSFVRMV